MQVMTVVLGASLALHAVFMPYEYGHANWLEVLSLVVTIITLYFALYFSFALDATPLVVVTVMVILMNVITVVIFLYALIRAHWYSGVQRLGLKPKVRAEPARLASHFLYSLAWSPIKNELSCNEARSQYNSYTYSRFFVSFHVCVSRPFWHYSSNHTC